MKLLCRALLLASAAMLVTTLASAEPSVALERPAGSSCVDVDELVRMLGHVRIDAEVGGSGGTLVSVAGTPEALRVTLQRSGSSSTVTLSPATCATATDVVAAFLASALGPPPPMPSPVRPQELSHAIGDELARREIQLALRGVRLTLTRDHWGNLSARLAYASAPDCFENVPLGVIDRVTPKTVAAAADVLEVAIRALRPCPVPPPPPPPPPPPKDLAEPERVRLLKKALARVPPPAQGVGFATTELTNALLYTPFVMSPPKHPSGWPPPARGPGDRALRAYGNGVLLGGGIGSLLLRGDRSQNFGIATLFGGYGLLTLGTFFGGSEFGRHSTAAGFLATTALATLNLARPLPSKRLWAEGKEVARPTLTRSRAALIERDLEHADPFVPMWLVLTPAVAGSSVAALHAVWSKEDSSLVALDVVFAASFGAVIVVDAVEGSISSSYERALHAAGLAELGLAPGPALHGLSLVGRF